MTNYRVLIVDDIETQRQALSDSIKEFNQEKKTEGISIEIKEADNLKNALALLKDIEFDFAIVDLVLSNASRIVEGNEIVKYIRNHLRIPVFVLSDFPDRLDVELQKETAIFKIKQRTKITYKELVAEIHSLLQSEITQLVRALKTNVHDAMQELYWSHIAHNWGYWSETIKDPKQREKILARYLSSILVEKMNLSEDGIDKSHVAEMFFIPPIKSDYYTGDIIEISKQLFLIINPACDMIVRGNGARSAESIILLSLIPLSAVPKFRDHFASPSAASKDKIQKLIENKNGRYHYLPPYHQLDGFIIDYEKINAIVNDEFIKQKPIRIASITEPFLKNIITRFSNYYNRLGQPDFDINSLVTDLGKYTTTSS